MERWEFEKQYMEGNSKSALSICFVVARIYARMQMTSKSTMNNWMSSSERPSDTPSDGEGETIYPGNQAHSQR